MSSKGNIFSRSRVSTALIGFLFVTGLAVFVYPLVCEWQSARTQAVVIENYGQAVERLEEKDIEAMRESARRYNEALFGNVVLTEPFDPALANELSEQYESLLNIDGDGVMGVVSIPEIRVKLPIYHGTSSDALSRGAGHLENTSLPIGGIGTHAVISAHNGFPQARLFTDLGTLEEGDYFFVETLGENLAYVIDRIKIVEPKETGGLLIDSSKDYVTLATCVPYGVNSHRLLVRGERTDYEEVSEDLPNMEAQGRSVLARPYVVAGFVAVAAIGAYAVGKLRERRSGDAE